MGNEDSNMGLRVVRPLTSLKKQVVESIRTAIFEGHLEPGARLVERQLCEALDVSRTLLREALSQLEVEGLVRIIPHRGPMVAVYSAEEARSVYEVRASLEEMAGRLFVERATLEEYARLDHELHQLKLAYRATDSGDRLAVKSAFYGALTAGTHNSTLVEMLRIIQGRASVLRSLTLASPGRIEQSIGELTEIVAAIERRDAVAAGIACRRHVENAGALAIKLLLEREQAAVNSEPEAQPAKKRDALTRNLSLKSA